ncbi:hypothetical protein GCM10020370_23780 [Paenibacillus hodogayensis]
MRGAAADFVSHRFGVRAVPLQNVDNAQMQAVKESVQQFGYPLFGDMGFWWIAKFNYI